MGKHGPCYHCGVTSTPLWRNGPPEKPVLCNACGSRWRTKGTLENYTPLHARAEPDEFEDYKASKAKAVYMKNKEAKVLKRKYDNNNVGEFGGVSTDYTQGMRKGFDEDTSNRSSSGSAISNSESCVQYGSADASVTGPSQAVVWDTMVPSRKRTCVTRPKPSPVEKLTRDLYTIWHEQQSSCLSVSSEEDLLLECDKPMVSVEIGHGSVLIRHPSSIAREEESEASSLSLDNKQHTLSSSRLVTFPGLGEGAGANLSGQGIGKIKKPTNPGMEQDNIRRDKDQHEKLLLLAHHNSPLCFIDLEDILNFEKFESHLTNEEQQRLLKFLPSVDTSKVPESLRSMFMSSQFRENMLTFQNLLGEGLFDNSLSGFKPEDCRVQKKLVLCNSAKSKWVEQYKSFKDSKGKNIVKPELAAESDAIATGYSLSVRRSRDVQHQKISGGKAIMKSPMRVSVKASYDQKELIDKGSSFLSPKSLFSYHNNDDGSQVLDSSTFADQSSEQDLLLDVPSNGYFPQAELLLPSSSFGAQASTSSSSIYPNFGRP